MSFLHMSVTAAVLISAIMLVRTVALNRLPKTMFLLLWLVVLARLLVPMAIPVATAALPLRFAASSSADVPIPQWSGEFQQSASVVQQQTVQIPAPTQTPSTAPPLSNIAWLAGVLITAVFFTICYARTRLRLASASKIHGNAAIDKWLRRQWLARRITCYKSAHITTPLTVGLIRPKIILPSGMVLDERLTLDRHQMLDHVLTHEYFHIRRFDALWKGLLVLAVCLHWFNPLVWVMLVFANRDLELTCDEMTLRHLGADKKAAYAKSLICMAEQKNLLANGLVSGFGTFKKSAAAERIGAVMKMKRTTIFGILVSALLLSAIAFGANVTLAQSAPRNELPRVEFSSQHVITRVHDDYGNITPEARARLQEMIDQLGLDVDVDDLEVAVMAPMDGEAFRPGGFFIHENGSRPMFSVPRGDFFYLITPESLLGSSESRPVSRDELARDTLQGMDSFEIFWQGGLIDLLADEEISAIIYAGATWAEVFDKLLARSGILGGWSWTHPILPATMEEFNLDVPVIDVLERGVLEVGMHGYVFDAMQNPEIYAMVMAGASWSEVFAAIDECEWFLDTENAMRQLMPLGGFLGDALEGETPTFVQLAPLSNLHVTIPTAEGRFEVRPVEANSPALERLAGLDEFYMWWRGGVIDLLADEEVSAMIRAGATWADVLGILFSRPFPQDAFYVLPPGLNSFLPPAQMEVVVEWDFQNPAPHWYPGSGRTRFGR